jgi:hypothetical protein
MYSSWDRFASVEEDPITIGISRQNPAGLLIFMSVAIIAASPQFAPSNPPEGEVIIQFL